MMYMFCTFTKNLLIFDIIPGAYNDSVNSDINWQVISITFIIAVHSSDDSFTGTNK